MRFLWLRKQACQFAAHAIRRSMSKLQAELDRNLALIALYKRRMEREKRMHPDTSSGDGNAVQDWEREGEGWKDTP